MVEVFTTGIENRHMAAMIQSALLQQFPDMEVNIDLDDCDRILRCESECIDTNAVIAIVKSHKIEIAILT